jgi:hypothetical protein
VKRVIATMMEVEKEAQKRHDSDAQPYAKGKSFYPVDFFVAWEQSCDEDVSGQEEHEHNRVEVANRRQQNNTCNRESVSDCNEQIPRLPVEMKTQSRPRRRWTPSSVYGFSSQARYNGQRLGKACLWIQ